MDWQGLTEPVRDSHHAARRPVDSWHLSYGDNQKPGVNDIAVHNAVGHHRPALIDVQRAVAIAQVERLIRPKCVARSIKHGEVLVIDRGLRRTAPVPGTFPIEYALLFGPAVPTGRLPGVGTENRATLLPLTPAS